MLLNHSLSCMPTLTCNGLHITSNIWIHLEKVETDEFRKVECWKSWEWHHHFHLFLPRRFLCSTSRFLLRWLLTLLGVQLAQQLDIQRGRCPGIVWQTTPRAVFIVTPPAFCSNPLSDPSVTLATPKSGLQMTWLDRSGLANMPRQVEHALVGTSEEVGWLIWQLCVCRQLGWTTGVHSAVMWLLWAADCVYIQRWYE